MPTRPTFEQFEANRDSYKPIDHREFVNRYQEAAISWRPPPVPPILTPETLNQEYILLALTCLLIAAKNFEPDENLPKMHTLQRALGPDAFFSWSRVVRCEQEILELLEWNAEVKLPHDFVKLMHTFGVAFPEDECEKEMDQDFVKAMTRYIAVFIDLSAYRQLFEYSNLELGLTSVACARRHYEVKPYLSDRLLETYGKLDNGTSKD